MKDGSNLSVCEKAEECKDITTKLLRRALRLKDSTLSGVIKNCTFTMTGPSFSL